MSKPLKAALVATPFLAAILAALAIGLNAFESPPPRPPGEAAGGRLVVVVVFDQLRGDYLTKFAPLFGPDGFARVERDGVWYPAAYLPYAASSTGPGHAAIATGQAPAVTGVVENSWYDRTRKRPVYCASGDRPYERVPPGKLGGRVPDGGGLSPERVLCPTIGDRLRDADPASRVVSLALKDRAAVLMGGRKPEACYCFDTDTGEFHTSAYYRERPHDWVTAFNQSAAADHWFGQQWTPLPEGTSAGPGRFPHALSAGQTEPNRRYYAALEASPFGNELLGGFARAAIRGEGLGTRGTRDLLFLGFSANDMVGHGYGPDSREALDITVRSDRLLADILRTLDAEVGPGNYTLFVTADHGVAPLPELVPNEPAAQRFDPRELVPPLNRVLEQRFGKTEAGAWVEHLDFPVLTLNRRAADEAGVSPEVLQDAAAQWCENRLDWAASAWPSHRLAGPPLADPVGRLVQLSFHPERSGDVTLVAKPYALPLGRASTGTTHGSPHDYDRHVALLACGHGVPRLGKREGRVSSLALAAMLGHALGLPPAAELEPLAAGWAGQGDH